MSPLPGLNVAAFLPRSRANGPGERAVVWVQGCPRPVCPGCWNPAFLDVRREVSRVSPIDLADKILALDGLDGVTFSGGEPFHQAEGLAEVARRVRARGLHVLVFTGYELAELREKPGALALIEATDVLVAGPYERQSPCEEPLRSSTNQVVHVLRGPPLALETDVEVHIAADGALTITGFPPPALRR